MQTDMYSLGIVLFELFQPFRTKMEQSIAIEGLKKSCKFPAGVQKNFAKQVHILLLSGAWVFFSSYRKLCSIKIVRDNQGFAE